MPELFHLVSLLFDQRGKCQCGSPPAGVPRVGPGPVPGGVVVDERVVMSVGVAVEGARDGGRAEQAVALEEAPRLGVVPAGTQVVELEGRVEHRPRVAERLPRP